MLLFALVLLAQAPREAPPAPRAPERVLLKAKHLIDGSADAPRDGYAVLVEGDRILQVGPAAELQAQGARTVDLGAAWLLPGLIDAHTHVLLQGDVTAADYDEQLLKESIPYRALRASAAARTAVMNGFTSIRDLETEGAMYADVDLKTAIARGVIPGPRMFVATRAFAPTGTYPLLGYSWELSHLPEGVQIVDGPDAIRKAVREQVKYGADWIKLYADRKYYRTSDPRRPLRSWVNFTRPEMEAMVDEAHRLGRKVAAHAMGWDGIDAALTARVDSIEHGDGLTDDLIDRVVKQNVYWCPTIYVGIWVAQGRGGIWPDMIPLEREAFAKALKRGVRIAYGTDAGGYSWSENQAKELSILVRYGMSPMAAIKSATSVAAALLDPLCPPQAQTCEGSNVGVIAPGKFADLIAVAEDPLKDVSALERVHFVMKNGAILKMGTPLDGVPVNAVGNSSR
jgi:imidazolonepropionase-like amidohydrolase